MTKKRQSILSKLYLLLFWIKEVKNNKDRNTFNFLWQKTWLNQGYATQETLPELVKHYQKYDSISKDFILYFLNKPIGTIRLVVGNTLPVLEDFEIQSEHIEIAKMEVTLMTLEHKFQRQDHLASLLMMRQFYRFARQNEYDGAVMATDSRLFKLLNVIGFHMIKIGQEKFYEGSITIPAYIDLVETAKKLPKRNMELYKFFT